MSLLSCAAAAKCGLEEVGLSVMLQYYVIRGILNVEVMEMLSTVLVLKRKRESRNAYWKI